MKKKTSDEELGWFKLKILALLSICDRVDLTDSLQSNGFPFKKASVGKGAFEKIF